MDDASPSINRYGDYVTVYTLAVNGGTGSGSFPAGRVVGVSANAHPLGRDFPAGPAKPGQWGSRSAAIMTLNDAL